MIHKLNSQSVCRKSLEFIRDPVCYNKKCNILHISDLFLSYFLDTTQSRRRRDNADGEFDDISLNNRPELEFTCKFNRNITVDDDLNVNELSVDWIPWKIWFLNEMNITSKWLVIRSRNIIGEILSKKIIFEKP